MPPDTYCTHCRGAYTAGCEYCNPHIIGTTYTIPRQLSNLPEPQEPPLTDDEIRKVRALLGLAGYLVRNPDEPLKYKGVEIVWGPEEG